MTEIMSGKGSSMYRSRYFLLGLLLVSVACGGGGGSDDGVVGGGGGSTTLVLGFTPDQPSPGSNTVTAARQSSSGNTMTLAVNVTDTNGIHGAAFDLVFDSSVAQFVSWSPGSLLESGGETVNYAVNQPSSGRLVVGVSRTLNAPTVDAIGSQPLVRLTFRAIQVGSGSLAFQNGTLVDDQAADLAGITWAGGTFNSN